MHVDESSYCMLYNLSFFSLGYVIALIYVVHVCVPKIKDRVSQADIYSNYNFCRDGALVYHRLYRLRQRGD